MALVLLIIVQSVLLCGGQVLLKIAMAHSVPWEWSWACIGAWLTNWWLLGAGISLTAAGIMWMYILKHYPFSLAYPLSSITYVLGMIAAMVVFKENVVWTQWVGILLILAGAALIVK